MQIEISCHCVVIVPFSLSSSSLFLTLSVLSALGLPCRACECAIFLLLCACMALHGDMLRSLQRAVDDG